MWLTFSKIKEHWFDAILCAILALQSTPQAPCGNYAADNAHINECLCACEAVKIELTT